jgi:pseudouridine-5'-phosphate glycosidase
VIEVSESVANALANGEAVVALESTVLTHGLPRPENLALGRALEGVVRERGATPATIAIIAGRIHVGLSDDQLEDLAHRDADKASLWNLAALVAQRSNAGTTVATTLHIAAAVGIEVFATGGIGGVHHDPFDESADLPALARYPLITVCAGPKNVLNVEATLERLETLGVPVLGWRSDHLAGFHVAKTKLRTPTRVESATEVASIAAAQRQLGLKSGILVSQPVDDGLDPTDVERWLAEAHSDAQRAGVRGRAVTPMLLAAIAKHSDGASVRVNGRLLQANAALAADIARAMCQHGRERSPREHR